MSDIPRIKTMNSSNIISTDDLAFSAWLKMNGYPIIKSHQNNHKSYFSFEIDQIKEKVLKIEFLNSSFLKYYNELRNLKKVI